jgi:hypothetical protein
VLAKTHSGADLVVNITVPHVTLALLRCPLHEDSLVLVLLATPFLLDSAGIFARLYAVGLNTSELWSK